MYKRVYRFIVICEREAEGGGVGDLGLSDCFWLDFFWFRGREGGLLGVRFFLATGSFRRRRPWPTSVKARDYASLEKSPKFFFLKNLIVNTFLEDFLDTYITVKLKNIFINQNSKSPLVFVELNHVSKKKCDSIILVI